MRTIVDQDGRAFTGPPASITLLRDGRFVLVDDRATASRPVVMDSMGRFVKYLAPEGRGPGEIASFAGPFRIGRGDTLFVPAHPSVMVFDPQLRFVRSISTELGVGDIQLTDSGFVVNSHRVAPDGRFIPFHLLSRDGRIIRSMGLDTFPLRSLHRFLIASSEGGFWANQYPTHRFERWTHDGRRLVEIDNRPSWFYMMPQGRLAPFTTVRSIREVNGQLWVLSWVPSPRIEQIVQEATGRRAQVTDGAGPRLPVERMYTTVIEVYDATTGKLLAERALNALGTHFIGDDRFVIYSLNSDDLAQLEIWEMKLKR